MLRRHGLKDLGLLLIAIALSGCAGAPKGELASRIRAGQESLVLIKMVFTSDDERRIVPYSRWAADDGVGLLIATRESGRILSGERLAWPHLDFVSPASREEGWLHIVLPKGTYYLAVVDRTWPSWGRSRERRYTGDPRQLIFKLVVPTSRPVVYAGSVHIFGNVERLLFGGSRVRQVTHGQIIDEADRATALSVEFLKEFGPLHKALMTRHTGRTLVY